MAEPIEDVLRRLRGFAEAPEGSDAYCASGDVLADALALADEVKQLSEQVQRLEAVVSGLYSHLPSNGSELVLFDVNRNAKLGPLLRPAAETALSRLMPPEQRNYRLTIVTNAGEGTDDAVERVIEAGSTTERTRALGLTYPKGVFSLSHVALPFPLTDSLYGLTPDFSEDFGINLGALAPRGERGTLIVSLDALLRMSSNPFFTYLAERIEERLPTTPATEAPELVRTPPASPPTLQTERPQRRRLRN